MTDSTFDRLEKRLPPPSGKTDRRRLLLTAGAALAGGLAGLAIGRLSPGMVSAPETAPEVVAGQQYLVLPELLINLRGTATVKLMKIGITLSITPANHAKLAAMEPVLVDGLQTYLRGLDEHDLEGRTGVESLRTDILRRVRLLAEPVPVEGVLLRTLILQ